jgi:hypothetical protein
MGECSDEFPLTAVAFGNLKAAFDSEEALAIARILLEGVSQKSEENWKREGVRTREKEIVLKTQKGQRKRKRPDEEILHLLHCASGCLGVARLAGSLDDVWLPKLFASASLSTLSIPLLVGLFLFQSLFITLPLIFFFQQRR